MRSGFTLLETLIGLVIAALIALVTLDSLSAVAAHAARLMEQGRRQTDRTLALMPLQRALEEAVPDYHDAAGIFEGEARLIRGLTMAPPSGAAGLPARFELRIETRGGQAVLVYLEQDRQLIVTSLEGDPAFTYQDNSGRLHEAWPPVEGLGAGDPLYQVPVPALILVRSGDNTLLAAAASRTTGLVVRVQDFELLL